MTWKNTLVQKKKNTTYGKSNHGRINRKAHPAVHSGESISPDLHLLMGKMKNLTIFKIIQSKVKKFLSQTITAIFALSCVPFPEKNIKSWRFNQYSARILDLRRRGEITTVAGKIPWNKGEKMEPSKVTMIQHRKDSIPLRNLWIWSYIHW